jgi:hypothetical protein
MGDATGTAWATTNPTVAGNKHDQPDDDEVRCGYSFQGESMALGGKHNTRIWREVGWTFCANITVTRI